MASNPIQKKVRNAALIGAAATLLVMSIVVAFLLMQLSNISKEQKEIEASFKTVYTLNQDVKAGQKITQDMLVMSTAQEQHIPSNAISTANNAQILEKSLIAKVNMNKNTVLTVDLVSEGEVLTDDIRKQEYNAIVLPVDLITGDYVDIRIQFPNGQDFIVISKKMVEIPVINGMESKETIWLNLSEDEILSMSSAIVEAYRINGSKIYATKYTEPGIQEAATPTYPLNAETVSLIQTDPNVTDTAENALRERYTEALVNIRNESINSELQKPENSQSNVSGKMNESIVKTQEERKQYLQSLANGAY